jgi:ATP-dependent helicase HepA
VLFDLSINPDLIEQRIGRLDRIGQKNNIQIHIPYLLNSAQEIIFHWLHDGIGLFSQSCSAGHEIYTHFSDRLHELINSQSVDKASLDKLVKETYEYTQDLTEKLQQGRDRLIELNSFDAEQANIIIKQIQSQTHTKELVDYMERVFDQLGIHSEFHSENAYIIKPSEHMQADLPGLKEDGTTITYEREKALSREDMEFVTWEHPMVSESLDMIMNSEFGNTAVATISTNAMEKGSLLIEAWYSINVIADKKLQLARYLPTTPTRCLLDNKGNDYSKAISFDILNPLCQSLPKKTAIAIVNKTKLLTTHCLELSRQKVDKELVGIKKQALDKMQADLGGELIRLKSLQKKNKTIRDDEITYLEDSIKISEELITKSEFQVQAIRLIVNN